MSWIVDQCLVTNFSLHSRMLAAIDILFIAMFAVSVTRSELKRLMLSLPYNELCFVQLLQPCRGQHYNSASEWVVYGLAAFRKDGIISTRYGHPDDLAAEC